jgi:hypothetical protein
VIGYLHLVPRVKFMELYLYSPIPYVLMVRCLMR